MKLQGRVGGSELTKIGMVIARAEPSPQLSSSPFSGFRPSPRDRHSGTSSARCGGSVYYHRYYNWIRIDDAEGLGLEKDLVQINKERFNLLVAHFRAGTSQNYCQDFCQVFLLRE
ncbi:unnamed protein product [Strongylus vulgaris]|uniref:Uncharacterized protein n=1 Tax=Strongylus vulgaris TaxID=40348 RepID=A0A3P7I7E6_STRVU|nr:unnamed protein product [Strongylus vulgaris]